MSGIHHTFGDVTAVPEMRIKLNWCSVREPFMYYCLADPALINYFIIVLIVYRVVCCLILEEIELI